MTATSVRDIYFHESLLDVREVYAADRVGWLQTTGLLLFTPDAIVSGQVSAGVRLLDMAGFRPVATGLVHIDRLKCREIWRRELIGMEPETLDRLAVCDLLFPYTDSIAMLLRDERPVAGLPASQRLSRLKGSGEPALREPGTLRRQLSSPNNVFRLVHASDGPDELVRELGILFDVRRRRELLYDARHGHASADEIQRFAARAIEPVGARDLDTTPSLRRVSAAVQTRLRHTTEDPVPRNLPEQLARLGTGTGRGFRALRDALEAASVPLDTWDLIALGAVALAHPAAAAPTGEGS